MHDIHDNNYDALSLEAASALTAFRHYSPSKQKTALDPTFLLDYPRARLLQRIPVHSQLTHLILNTTSDLRAAATRASEGEPAGAEGGGGVD